MKTTRRGFVGLVVPAASAIPFLTARAGGQVLSEGSDLNEKETAPAPGGIEGQRQPDLGNGQYLNPVLAGGSSRPKRAERRGRLLHELFVLRLLPGHCHLALPRSGELEPCRSRPQDKHRIDMGVGSRQAQWTIFHLHPHLPGSDDVSGQHKFRRRKLTLQDLCHPC